MIVENRDSQSSKSASLKRRAAYSLAAGVAVAGVASDADAIVVYSGLKNIPVNQFSAYSFDIDNNTFNDIKLKNYVFGTNYQSVSTLFAPGKVVGFGNSPLHYYATALGVGSPINNGALGPQFYGTLAYGNPNPNPNAQFKNVTDAYIGFSFPDAVNTYFGWMRVDVNNAAGTLLVKDWAYETQPGIGIAAGAPEPGSLGLLAAGAAGVLALRRKRAQQEV